VGYGYEYGGEVIENMTMEERMTVCNMAIEGGARVGYVNPDQTTFDYLRDRPHVPTGEDFDRAVTWWKSMASDSDAEYDDTVNITGEDVGPTVTWGITPGQSVPVDGKIPKLKELEGDDQKSLSEALDYMGLTAGQSVSGIPVDVTFIGSCTNGRISDLREAAKVAKGRKVAKGVKALVVPGSQQVRAAAEAEGLHEVFEDAGFEWRGAGCSMCLAMNPDKLKGNQLCASSSNRNFKGRQGSPTGRTMLMSPAMVAAAAVCGEVTDVRSILN
jgi:3-isopropylmalate/(R)-2-methylmalate dehydratase large subunit